MNGLAIAHSPGVLKCSETTSRGLPPLYHSTHSPTPNRPMPPSSRVGHLNKPPPPPQISLHRQVGNVTTGGMFESDRTCAHPPVCRAWARPYMCSPTGLPSVSATVHVLIHQASAERNRTCAHPSVWQAWARPYLCSSTGLASVSATVHVLIHRSAERERDRTCAHPPICRAWARPYMCSSIGLPSVSSSDLGNKSRKMS